MTPRRRPVTRSSSEAEAVALLSSAPFAPLRSFGSVTLGEDRRCIRFRMRLAFSTLTAVRALLFMAPPCRQRLHRLAPALRGAGAVRPSRILLLTRPFVGLGVRQRLLLDTAGNNHQRRLLGVSLPRRWRRGRFRHGTSLRARRGPPPCAPLPTGPRSPGRPRSKTRRSHRPAPGSRLSSRHGYHLSPGPSRPPEISATGVRPDRCYAASSRAKVPVRGSASRAKSL